MRAEEERDDGHAMTPTPYQKEKERGEKKSSNEMKENRKR